MPRGDTTTGNFESLLTVLGSTNVVLRDFAKKESSDQLKTKQTLWFCQREHFLVFRQMRKQTENRVNVNFYERKSKIQVRIVRQEIV